MRSSVTTSKSRTDLLYSGGLPAATMIQPSGIFWLPNILHCRNCSIVGASVSDTQLISSIKRIPSFNPVSSILSYIEAIISLIVYSVTEYSFPLYTFFSINGSPTALCLVWCVIVYATSATLHSFATCSMTWVFPIPGGPIKRIGLCLICGII